MTQPTVWDRIATLGDPRKLASRVAARASLEYMARSQGFEAGGNGRRLVGWGASSSGPNTQVAGALSTVRRRHRDLIRNGPWGKRAKEAIQTHTVGHGITVEFKAKKGTEADVAFVNALWADWFESNACDWMGQKDGYMIQNAVLGETVMSGDAFVRARWLHGNTKGPVPLKLQVVPAAFCDETKSENLLGAGRITQGVQMDAEGRRTAYWMFSQHPNDDAVSVDPVSRPIPADEFAHCRREDEEGQVRGMPWGHAVLVSTKDLHDYSDAYLFRQKIANLFGAFIHDTDAPTLNPAVSSSNNVLPDTLEPGAILALPAGKKITHATPPKADDYGPFTQDKLYEIAAGYGITFQMLTGRLDNVNFTSGRMGYLDVSKNIDQWRWLMLIPQVIVPITQWFLEAVALKHGINVTGMYPEITPPLREMMDPPREVPAEIKAIRGGLYSLAESHRSRGMRTVKVLDEIEQTNKLLDERNITLDTDPRKVSSQGQVQKEPTDSDDEAGGAAERDFYADLVNAARGS